MGSLPPQGRTWRSATVAPNRPPMAGTELKPDGFIQFLRLLSDEIWGGFVIAGSSYL
jgi:hypothetical protein